MAFAAAGMSMQGRTRKVSPAGNEPAPLGQPQLFKVPSLEFGQELSVRENFRRSILGNIDPVHNDHHNHHLHVHNDHHNHHLHKHKSKEDLADRSRRGSEADHSVGQQMLRKLLADQLAVVQQALLSSQRSISESIGHVLEQGERDAQQLRVLLVQAGAAAAPTMPGMVNHHTRKASVTPIFPPEITIKSGTPDDTRSRQESVMSGAIGDMQTCPLSGAWAPMTPNSSTPVSNYRKGSTLPVQLSGGTPSRGSARGNLQMEPMMSEASCEEEGETGGSKVDETGVQSLAPSRRSVEFDQEPSMFSAMGQSWTTRSNCRGSDGSMLGIDTDDTPEHSMSLKRPAMKFTLSHAWTEANEHEAARIGNIREVRNKSLIRAYTKTDFQEIEAKGRNRRKWVEGHFHSFVIYPYCIKRAMWDAISLLVVLYDVIAIPLQLFSPGSMTFTDVMAWIVRVFWTVDMPLSFLTGFMMSDGVIEMRVRKIVRHYCQSWFALDFALVVMDWIELFGGGGAAGYARMGKASRTFRILRMVRLLRLFRMREVFRQFSERFHSERLTIVLDIAKMMIVILGLAHVLACLWYGIGVQGTSRNTWVRGEDPGFEDAPLVERYIISLRWSLSQFSGGMEDLPSNTVEHLFASSAFVLAFIMAAVFVSGLTSSMTRLDILASYQSRQLAVLRRYLVQNRISDKLTLRVQRNAIHAMSEAQRLMQESSVDLLQIVSEPLRVELHFEMYAGVLEVHPLFHRYIDHCPQVMRRVCHMASSTLLVSKGDLIFNAGEIPTQPKMYIVCTGSFEYVPIAGDVSKVEGASWLAEACLWVPWMHRGVLKAVQDGRLCLLDSNRFAHVATQFFNTDFNPRFYAEKYVEQLNRCKDPLMLTDLATGIEHILVEEGKHADNSTTMQRGWLRRMPSIFMAHDREGRKSRRSTFFETVMPR